MKIDKKIFGFTVALIFAITILSVTAYYVGLKQGLEETRNIVIKNVTNLEPGNDIAVDFSIFWEAWGKLIDKHVGADEISEQELLYGAIKGLTEAFGDSNTVFFAPIDSQKFSEDISGNFSGIGAEIGLRNGQLVVIAPLKDTPAERSGLRAGDRILSVDGVSTNDVSVNDAVSLIRGEIGSTVTLKILRDDEGEVKISIVRANITIPTVDWKIVDDNIIHMQIFSFSGNTPAAFRQAVIGALFVGGEGMVLDLRGNPGGFLNISINLAGWFLERGVVVVTEDFTSGEERMFHARGNEALIDFPVVVLINEGSASASEILAGALRVHREVKLIGVQSFGKGTVQELEKLSDGSTLKITVANWLLPDGTPINGYGLTPDFIVELTEEDIEANRDPQLEKAIEVLKESL